MKKVTHVLAPRVHDIRKDGQTIKVQFVPQLISTLRLDLVFWSNLLSEQPKAQFDSMSKKIIGKLPPKMKV